MKLKRTYTLTNEVVQIIEFVAKENECTRTAAVEYLILNYISREESSKQLERIVVSILHKELQPIVENTKRMRITSNVIDRHIQMLLEFWNHYFIVNDFNELGTTEIMKTDELYKAEKLVKERITKQYQRKLDARGGNK